MSRPLPSMLCAAVLLAACGGGDWSGIAPPPPVEPPLACVALPQEISWHRDVRSSAWNDVLIDPLNRVWMAGWTHGDVGQGRSDPSGDSRVLLHQRDARGQLLWDAGLNQDTPGTDVAEALLLSPQGTLFVAGRTSGAWPGAVNAGQFDSFVAWSDQPGTAERWRFFQTGTRAPQRPQRLALGTDGGLLLAGQDDESIPTNHVEAWTDAFAMRLQRVGAGTADDRLALGWHHQAGSDEPDIAGGLAEVGDATFISGTAQGGLQRGMYLRRLDAQGQAVWTARYSTTAIDHVAVVRRLSATELLIAGSVFGSFQGAEAAGQQDVFVARVSSEDGRVLQRWQFGSEGAEWLADMQVDAAGQVYLFGETDGRLVAGQAAAGGTDLFLLKLAADGRVLARRQWGTADEEYAARLAVDGCGGIVAVGSSGTATRRDALAWFWRP